MVVKNDIEVFNLIKRYKIRGKNRFIIALDNFLVKNFMK